MTADTRLRDRLEKVEALFAGAATAGERAAAGAAAERIRARLRRTGKAEPDPWSRQLFIALARRYGLQPFRYRRQRRTTVMLRGPRSFLEQVLWPEFLQINEALVDYLADVTDRIIRDEVFAETADAEEVDAPARLGG